MKLVDLSQFGLELLHFNLVDFDLIVALGLGLLDLDFVRFLHLLHLRLEVRGLSFLLRFQACNLLLKL